MLADVYGGRGRREGSWRKGAGGREAGSSGEGVIYLPTWASSLGVFRFFRLTLTTHLFYASVVILWWHIHFSLLLHVSCHPYVSVFPLHVSTSLPYVLSLPSYGYIALVPQHQGPTYARYSYVLLHVIDFILVYYILFVSLLLLYPKMISYHLICDEF